MDWWDEIRGLSPEEQTEWLKHHLRDWDEFVEGIRISHEELEAHRASGATGYPPGWISLDEFREQFGLSANSEQLRSAPTPPTQPGDP